MDAMSADARWLWNQPNSIIRCKVGSPVQMRITHRAFADTSNRDDRAEIDERHRHGVRRVRANLDGVAMPGDSRPGDLKVRITDYPANNAEGGIGIKWIGAGKEFVSIALAVAIGITER